MNQDSNNGSGKFFDRDNIDKMVNSNFEGENQSSGFFDKSMLSDVSNNLEGQNSSGISVSSEIESNKVNEEQYQYIIDNAKKNDVYWDRNNLFVRAILIALFSFAVVGTICFLLLWFSGE